MRVIIDSKPPRTGLRCSISIWVEGDDNDVDDDGNPYPGHEYLPPGHALHGRQGGCREMADQAMLWAIELLTRELRASAAFVATKDGKYLDEACSAICD